MALILLNKIGKENRNMLTIAQKLSDLDNTKIEGINTWQEVHQTAQCLRSVSRRDIYRSDIFSPIAKVSDNSLNTMDEKNDNLF